MLAKTLNQFDIAARIPHAGSMSLLHSVEAWDSDSIECTAISHLQTYNPLRRDGMLPAVTIIEYAAQAMAVHGSLISQQTENSSPKEGRLVSVRELEMTASDLSQFNGMLHIHCELLLGDVQSSTFFFVVKHNKTMIAQGRASVMVVNS